MAKVELEIPEGIDLKHESPEGDDSSSISLSYYSYSSMDEEFSSCDEVFSFLINILSYFILLLLLGR